jgi:predicted alpha/beta superfamily hydrolase
MNMILSSTAFAVRRLLRQLPAGCAVLVLILAPILCNSHAEEDSDSIVMGKYVKFYSEILDEEVKILVHLPYAYDRTHLSYPVLYSLDGDDVSRFSKSAATLEELNSNGKIPKMILVTPANTDRIPIRLDNDPDSLRAGEFIRFMVEELIPFVDENYRTADYKILFGQSNAGLFTVYSLLDRPESFNAYIASSPMLGWCSDFIFKKAEDLFDGNRSLNNFLFIIYGKSDYDRVTSYVPDFARLLEAKAPRDFRWKVKVLDEEGHVPYTSLYDGLKSVFSDWDFPGEREAEAGLEEIKDFYRSLSETYGFNAQIPFGLLLDLAMRYVGQGTLDEAVEVLKANVEQYPYYGGAYYYLAEVYRRKDNNELAIENYQKALEVDPEYLRREVILRRIESLK